MVCGDTRPDAAISVANQHGIGWTLARTWSGTRSRERQIKNMGGASRRCPMCGIKVKPEGPVT